VATREAPVHANVKLALVNHNETDTRLIMRSLRNTERVLHNPAADKVLAIESRGNTQIQDLIPYVSGLVGKEMLEMGDVDRGTLAAGQCIGLIRDIPTCRELLDRIMAEAEEIIKTRFARMLSAG
jgi:nitronate monooxygenase